MLREEYIQGLVATQQNPKYHAEGNAWQHTLMVLEQYENYAASHALTEHEKTVLYWACLVHDIGKPVVSVWKDNRWTAKGHEVAGVPIARKILHQQPNITALQRHQILDLVRWHHLPLRWIDKEKPFLEFQRLATRTDLRLIGRFATFDLEGRICNDKEYVRSCYTRFNEEVLPKVEALSGDFDWIQGHYEAASSSHKRALWNAYKMSHPVLWEKLLRRSSPSEDKPEFHCVISIGVPRAGKTTWLREHYPNALHLSVSGWDLDGRLLEDVYDRQRVFTTFQHHIGSYYREFRTIVLDGNNLSAETRQAMVGIIRSLKGRITMVFFDSSWESVVERNGMSENPISLGELNNFYYYLRYPHPWEADEILIV